MSKEMAAVELTKVVLAQEALNTNLRLKINDNPRKAVFELFEQCLEMCEGQQTSDVLKSKAGDD